MPDSQQGIEVFTAEQAEILVGRLRKLSDHLRYATTEYVALKGEREATKFSIAAIEQCLCDFNFPLEQRSVLTRLVHALGDLDQGTVEPLLQPANVGSRPMQSTHAWVAKAYLVSAVEALISLGAAPDAACHEICANNEQVISSILGRPKRGSNQRGLASRLLSLRKEFQRRGGHGPRDGSHHLAIQEFQKQLIAAAALDGAARVKQIRELSSAALKLANDYARHNGAVG